MFVISQKLLAHLKTAGTYLFVKKQFTRVSQDDGKEQDEDAKVHIQSCVVEEDIRFWFLLFGSAFE